MVGDKKCRAFLYVVKVKLLLLKNRLYNCKMLYVSLLVTTKQKPILDMQMMKRKESKHPTTEHYKKALLI